MNFPDLTSTIRENARLSFETAHKIEKALYEKVIGPHLAQFEKELTAKFLEREKALEEEIEKLKNEPLLDMIKRIAAEAVEEEVRNNLTVTKDIDYDGFERISTQWNGKEF